MGSSIEEGQISRNLRELRAQRSWTREQAAERIGIAAETLARFERGERRPSLRVLMRLSQGYAVSMDELTGPQKSRERDLVAECVQVLGRLDDRRLRLARDILATIERAEF
jgi:transcriptional regulator with XRE-family HTH domain